MRLLIRDISYASLVFVVKVIGPHSYSVLNCSGGCVAPGSWGLWDVLRATWSGLGLSWMPLGGLLGSSWGLLGGSRGPLGAIFGPLGAVLGPLGVVL